MKQKNENLNFIPKTRNIQHHQYSKSQLQQWIRQNNMTSTFKPSTRPGPRNDFDDVLLALSKLDLKTSGNPTLQD
jgi:hypothetical protein